MMIRKTSILACFASFFAMLLMLAAMPHQASSLGGSEFNPGKIIDDTVFYNTRSMNPSQIQAFLNSKVPSCDTNGEQIYSGSQTRAQWAAANGKPSPPYTCLKDYTETIPAITNTSADLCKQSVSAGLKTASQIIYDAAIACGINPQALIVLLQKEQSLITDSWPWPNQYRSATGYGCPDTAPCDAEYYGFFNQVYQAAKAYRRYEANPNNYNYKANRNNFINYNPNSSCGGSTVYIHNQATASLYIYTPYQPNAAALNNLYGTGDSCSAYGNRNFWRMFNDWFGNTNSLSLLGAVTMTSISPPDTTPFKGQTVNYTVSFTNNLQSPLAVDAVGVVGRVGSPTSNVNRDFGWQGPIILQPGVAQQFTFSTTIMDTGQLFAWPAISYNGHYTHYNNWGTAMQSRPPNLSLVSPLVSSVANPVVDQSATLSATIQNNEDEPINLNAVGIPVRYYGAYNYDTAWTTSSSGLAAHTSKVVSGNVLFDKPGPYTAWLSGIIGNQFNTLSSELQFNVATPVPSFTLTYLETPNPAPAIGEDIVVKFKLKSNNSVNMTLDAVGVVGRYDSPYAGSNKDLGWQGPITFAPGEEKSFTTFKSTISDTRTFYTWVAIYYKGRFYHYNNWGFALTPHKPQITASTPLTINSGVTPTLGANSTVTVTLKNNEPKPINYSAVGIAARYYSVYNYDAVWQGPGTLAASGTAGDTVSLSGVIKFDKNGPYVVWPSILTAGNYLTIGSPTNLSF